MNRGTIQRAFSGYDGEKSPFQTKLTIGAPGDKYEQEADSMAEKVMSMDTLTATNSPTIQSDSEASFDSIQEQPLVQSIHPLIQRQIDSNKNSTQNRPIISSSEAQSIIKSKKYNAQKLIKPNFKKLINKDQQQRK